MIHYIMPETTARTTAINCIFYKQLTAIYMILVAELRIFYLTRLARIINCGTDDVYKTINDLPVYLCPAWHIIHGRQGLRNPYKKISW